MQVQWLVFVVFCLALAADHLVCWRGFERRVLVDAARARRILWTQWILLLWGCSLLVMASWILEGRPLAVLGLGMATGWRLGVPLALTAALAVAQFRAGLQISRLPDRTKLRERLGTTGDVVAHSASEIPLFSLAAVSAGFCEELLCRGFVIWLFEPFAGWWIAAFVSLAIFTLAHWYQGKDGMIKCALLGAVMTVTVALSHSLWPAIVLHTVIDLMAAWVGWQLFRDRDTAPAATEPLPSR